MNLNKKYGSVHHPKVFGLSFFFIFLFVYFFTGCGRDEDLVDACEVVTDSTTLTEIEALFFDLALSQEPGNDIPRLRKWNGNIDLFIEGTPTQELLNELNVVIAELNSLSTFVEIEMVNSVESSNLRFFFGTKEDYVTLVEPNAPEIGENTSSIVTIARNSSFEIDKASLCIDNTNFPDFEFQQYAIRKVMAQSLGLVNEITTFDNSIFHETIITNTSYSPLDREMIALMLGGALRPGFCPNTIIKVIEQ